MNPVLTKVLKRYLGAFIMLMVFSSLITIMTTAGTFFEGKLVDSLAYQADRSRFLDYFVLLTVFSGCRLFFSYFTSKVQFLKSQECIFDLNRSIISHLFGRDTLHVLAWDLTTLNSRINDDVNEIVSFYSRTWVFLTSNVITGIVVCGFIFFSNKAIFLFIAVFIPIYLAIYFFFKSKIYRTSLSVKNAQNEYFSSKNHLMIRYLGIKGKESFKSELGRLIRKQNHLFRRTKSSFWVNYGLSTSQIAIQLIFQITFIFAGGMAVLHKQITVGLFIVIIQYFSQLLSAIDNLLGASLTVQTYHVSLKRVSAILNIADEKNGDYQIKTVTSINVTNFNIKPFQQNVNKLLYSRPLTFTFLPNHLYTIAGDNGVGKSTFLYTLSGIYQPTYCGKLKINDLPLSKINLRDFRKNKLGFMLQDIPVPETTVVNYIKSVMSLDQMARVLQDEEFRNVFKSDLFNINLLMNREIRNLSTGEWQLLKLFTTLSKPTASVFFLDEPTANIFPALRQGVVNLLSSVSKHAIVITISHDEAIMAKGQVVNIV